MLNTGKVLSARFGKDIGSWYGKRRLSRTGEEEFPVAAVLNGLAIQGPCREYRERITLSQGTAKTKDPAVLARGKVFGLAPIVLSLESVVCSYRYVDVERIRLL
jgi:hypothetical protein